MAWRDARRERRRLSIFAASIVIGIGALVAIHSLRDSLEEGIGLQSRELLGSDLQVSARAPFSPEGRRILAETGATVDYETSFSTMMTFPSGQARLVQLRSMGGLFPFYGQIETKPAEAWSAMQNRNNPVLLLEPALLDQFEASSGEMVSLGEARLEISGTVLQSGSRTGRFAGFAPDVYANPAALAATGLLGRTSLASYHAHLKLPPASDADEVAEQMREQTKGERWKIETSRDRGQELGRVLDRFEQFLSLIALLSLVLGAVGVASAMHTQIRRRRPSIAILRCLGLSSNGSLAIYLVQATVLGWLATVAGASVGVLLHAGLVVWFGEELPITLSLWPSPSAVLLVALAGFLACTSFALLALLQVHDIPPLEVLRTGESFARRRRVFLRALPVIIFLFGLLAALSFLASASLVRSLFFPLGLTGVFLLLAAAGKILILVARQGSKAPLGYLVRQGLANLFRPQNQTLLYVISLGLGVFLLSLTFCARAQIFGAISATENSAGPNLYLVDVQPDQLKGLHSLLKKNGLSVLQSEPMVAMRLSSVKGRGVEELLEEDRVPRRFLRREFRSSYREELSGSESEAGGAWPPAPWAPEDPIPLSLESGMAKDLGVRLGDHLVVDIQGRKMKTEVVHLRKVDWSRLNLNYFMIFPYGVLESAPGFHVVTTRITAEQTSGRLQAMIAATFPNISAIDLSLILASVREILDRLALAIQIISTFTVAAGTLIVVGIFLNGREQRAHDAILLRTLGASTRQLRTILCVEFGALGLLSALAGCGLALSAHLLITRFILEEDPIQIGRAHV